ncbi:MAG: TetR/AcrR family transcriptional regulator C-terminal domain-containing protein [Erysipelotrichaceae bacterium]|nr:TetR/AcrR family transcriptional regulator C-terminal domain-containing protein [Erysipelotrichaceae bacterium]
MADRTKKMFADAIQQMAKHKLIKDIQVKELCEACNVERTTFYYHFKDKYDLVCWIFEQNFKEESKMSEVINSEEMIYRMCKRLLKQKDFFANALEDSSQNNLREYMLDFYIESERSILKDYLKVDELDEETDYEICQYSYGCMGHTLAWLQNINNLTVEKLAYYQYKFMPDILKKAFLNNRRDS